MANYDNYIKVLENNSYTIVSLSENSFLVSRNHELFAQIKRNVVTNGIDLIRWDSVLKRFTNFVRSETCFDKLKEDEKLMDKFIKASAER